VTGVPDGNAQGLGEEEDIVLIVLVDLEDLGIRFRSNNFFGKWDRFSIDDDIVHVVQLDLVFSHHDCDSELVVGDLLTQNDISWFLSTISSNEGWAFGQISEISPVVESLDGVRSDITISVDSEVESHILEFRESGVDRASHWSGNEGQIHIVEMFLFSLGRVEVDIGFWVFFIHGHVQFDFSLDKSIGGGSMFSMSGVSINRFAWYPIRHQDCCGKGSRIPPAFACIGINFVVDGDVRFPKVGLFESSPKTGFGGRGQISRIFGRSLLVTALFVWPSV